MYANGVACHPGWIVFAVAIGLSCYFLILFLMSRLGVTFSLKSFVAKQLFSLGYYVAPLLTYFLVLLMVKMVARH